MASRHGGRSGAIRGAIARGFLLLVILLAVAGCRTRETTVEVSVFFVRSEGTAFTVAEARRTVPRGGAQDLLAAALTALLEGPTEEERARGLSTAVPAGTRLRGVRIQDGTARVDFSPEVESGGGSASMLGRFWQIVYTATQFREARAVRILIDGRERQAMGGEGVIIEQPVPRPPEAPRF